VSAESKADIVWLSGSRGFIGHHTVPVLESAYSKLRCVTTGASDHGAAADDFISMDYSNADAVRAAISTNGLPDVFIHLGWGAMTDPGSDDHLTANVDAAKTLITTLYEEGLRKFVFIGSANEYGARTGCLEEDMPPEGEMTNYAKAKVEVAAFGFAKAEESGKIFQVVRPFYVFGPGQRKGSLINKLFRCSLTGTKAELGPCEHFRDYVYVGDVAEGIMRVSRTDESATVNVGSGNVIKLRDYVDLFWKAMGGSPEDLVFGANPMRAGEPEQPYAFASLERLKNLTGWAPTRTIEDGVKQTVKGLRARRKTDFADV